MSGKNYFLFNDSQLSDGRLNGLYSNEEIELVQLYADALAPGGIRFGVFSHSFVIVYTRAWYWSFEKNAQGVFVERSKYLWRVRDDFKHRARSGHVGHLKTENSYGKTINDVIKLIYSKNLLSDRYHTFDNNCHFFSCTLFKFIGNTDTCKSYINVAR